MDQKEKILGILGGMGPMATLHFYQKVLEETSADCDQNHLHVIIDCNCKIPDRTVAIRSGNLRSLLEALQGSANRLIRAGAALIALPCNTAHILYNDLQQTCSVEILNIIKETRAAFQRFGYKRPALLATEGTISSRLYQDEFDGFDLMLPEPKWVQEIQVAIMHIKRGNLREAQSTIMNAVSLFKKRGADSVVVGCTEIPLVVNIKEALLPVFDSSEILAKAAVSRCRSWQCVFRL